MIALKRPRSKPTLTPARAFTAASPSPKRRRTSVAVTIESMPRRVGKAGRLTAVRITGIVDSMDPKTMWGSGNYAAVAEKIAAVGEHVVEATGVEPGMEVLDVACGTGNATIPAARVGGARHRRRLLTRPARDRARACRRRDGRGRMGRGRRRGAAFRGRELRPRDLDLRAHVRPRSRAHGRRDEARLPRGRRDRRLLLDAGGGDRADVRDGRRADAAARRAVRRRSLGHRGARARAARRRPTFERREAEWRDLGGVLRRLHARELRPAPERPRGARRARRASCATRTSRISSRRTSTSDGTLRFRGEYLVSR